MGVNGSAGGFDGNSEPRKIRHRLGRPIWAGPLPMCGSAKVGAIEVARGGWTTASPRAPWFRADSSPMAVSPLQI
jgi:hypothetical protein